MIPVLPLLGFTFVTLKLCDFAISLWLWGLGALGELVALGMLMTMLTFTGGGLFGLASGRPWRRGRRR